MLKKASTTVNACDSLGANVFNLLLNLQNIFRDLFLKKSNIAKISIFKVQRNLQNTYRHFIQTSS